MNINVLTAVREAVEDHIDLVVLLGRAQAACRGSLLLEQIQRKFRVHERTPQNAPWTRGGATKKDQKAELKRTKNPQALSPQNLNPPPLIPLATRQARDAKSPKWKRSD